MTGTVIIGGGIAGISTAESLRNGGYEEPITVVDAGPFPYDRPPLCKDYLAGKLDSTDLQLQPPQWFTTNAVQVLSGHRVTALLPNDGMVEVDGDRTLCADSVVLAVGGDAARPPIAGIEHDRIHVLRTVDDADRLRSAMVPGATLVIVGGGLIGAETASTAIDLGCEVIMIDPVETPLSGAFGVDVAAWLHGLHARHGVQVWRDTVAGFAGTREGVTVHTKNGSSVRADAVLIAVGMTPQCSLAVSAGLRVERGIVIDDDYRTTNPAVLAVGDAASRTPRGMGGHGHWDNARQAGQRAAATILSAAPPPPAAPWFWTDRYGHHVEVVGTLGSAQQTVVRGVFGQAPFSVFGVNAHHVTGAVAVDDSAAVRAARRMIERNVTVDTAVLSDVTSNLRALMR